MKSGVVLFGLVFAGCATTEPPRELVDAQVVYQRVSPGPAARLEPQRLWDARQTLNEAERSFQENGDIPETRDLACIALRRSQHAEAQADLSLTRRAREQVERQRRSLTGEALDQRSAEVEDARRRAEEARTRAEEQRKSLAETEQRLKNAIEELGVIGSVREEGGGYVITLTGSVLFASNQHELLPSARRRLDEVATALKVDPEREIRVEGHSDSSGSEEHNIDLSQRRADSVRAYLVSRGVDPNRIEAVGAGEAHPVAPNESAEGRANNRRVEIIVAPHKE